MYVMPVRVRVRAERSERSAQHKLPIKKQKAASVERGGTNQAYGFNANMIPGGEKYVLGNN